MNIEQMKIIHTLFSFTAKTMHCSFPFSEIYFHIPQSPLFVNFLIIFKKKYLEKKFFFDNIEKKFLFWNFQIEKFDFIWKRTAIFQDEESTAGNCK